MTNRMKVEFDSISANEAFARVTAAAFLAQLNPSVEEVADVKTAVSEAVTNAIIHGYQGEVHTITSGTARMCEMPAEKALEGAGDSLRIVG